MGPGRGGDAGIGRIQSNHNPNTSPLPPSTRGTPAWRQPTVQTAQPPVPQTCKPWLREAECSLRVFPKPGLKPIASCVQLSHLQCALQLPEALVYPGEIVGDSAGVAPHTVAAHPGSFWAQERQPCRWQLLTPTKLPQISKDAQRWGLGCVTPEGGSVCSAPLDHAERSHTWRRDHLPLWRALLPGRRSVFPSVQKNRGLSHSWKQNSSSGDRGGLPGTPKGCVSPNSAPCRTKGPGDVTTLRWLHYSDHCPYRKAT